MCGTGQCLGTLAEQHCQLARLFGRLSLLDRSEIKLVTDCHGATEVNLVIALWFYSMTNSIESLERLERTHELVTALSVEVCFGVLADNRYLEAGE